MRSFKLYLLILLFCFPLKGALAESPIRPGDRIAIVGNTFADQLRIHGYLETLLYQNSPENPVSVRNLGWGGDMLTARDRPTNFPTEESTLEAHGADVIIACFGMGESFAGTGGLDEFKNALRAFLATHKGKSYNGESEVRLILVSPIAYENLGSITPNHQKRNAELEAYTLAMKQVAGESDTPFIDLFESTRYLMNEWEEGDFTTNGIHLSATGYWIVSHMLYDQMVRDTSSVWRVTVDAGSGGGEASGVEIADILKLEDTLTFRVTEKNPPSLPLPAKGSLPIQLSSDRDSLIVTNLKPGEYTLTIDGEKIASANNETWAMGVIIDSSPAHREAEALRAAIIDKNLQFTYSWKALNQVHIVGERRSSPSGRALPAEVREFNKLANEREEALKDQIGAAKTRTWRLTPNK